MTAKRRTAKRRTFLRTMAQVGELDEAARVELAELDGDLGAPTLDPAIERGLARLWRETSIERRIEVLEEFEGRQRQRQAYQQGRASEARRIYRIQIRFTERDLDCVPLMDLADLATAWAAFAKKTTPGRFRAEMYNDATIDRWAIVGPSNQGPRVWGVGPCDESALLAAYEAEDCPEPETLIAVEIRPDQAAAYRRNVVDVVSLGIELTRAEQQRLDQFEADVEVEADAGARFYVDGDLIVDARERAAHGLGSEPGEHTPELDHQSAKWRRREPDPERRRSAWLRALDRGWGLSRGH